MCECLLSFLPTGFYSYCFTAPGVYYYSSGYVNSANQISMQGVVNVRPLEERSTELNLTVAGFQALQYQGTNAFADLTTKVGFVP